MLKLEEELYGVFQALITRIWTLTLEKIRFLSCLNYHCLGTFWYLELNLIIDKMLVSVNYKIIMVNIKWLFLCSECSRTVASFQVHFKQTDNPFR